MRELLFGAAPPPEQLPGSRVDLPIDWAVMRFALWFTGIGWLALSCYALIPAVSHLVGKRVLTPDARWKLFAVATVSAAICLWSAISQYRRAVGVIFTSEGLWTPAWTGGRFRPWAELIGTRLRDGRNVELQYPDGVYKLYATGFKDPFAVSRLIRKWSGERVGSDLPVEGER